MFSIIENPYELEDSILRMKSLDGRKFGESEPSRQ